MKLLIRFSAISLFLSCMASCSNSNDYNNPNPASNVNFVAALTGSQETPANASAATGTSTLIYNPNNRTFAVTVTYSGITSAVTAGHIHKGALGVPGAAIFPFTTLSSPIYYTSRVLTTAEAADLNAGLYYVNIHSNDYPDGEIRGQYVKQ